MIYENVELYNVDELIEPKDREGKILTRIPNDLRITLNESARSAALYAAGCEIRFRLSGNSAKVVLKSEEKEPGAIAEVFQGNFHISQHSISSDATEICLSMPENIEVLDRLSKKENLPFDAKITRVILPFWPSVRLIEISGNVALPENNPIPEKKYLAYGSSITHGAWAIRPTGTYAMRTAQLLGVDLINLGFGGGAHCEKQMADYIAERKDWNFATLELGINMRGGETEEFKKRVEYFIARITESHPDKWIFCIDLFTFLPDFDFSSKKQNEFRQIVENTVKNLNMPKLIYTNGRGILRRVTGLTSDLVHPSPEGMEEIALNLSKYMSKHMKKR